MDRLYNNEAFVGCVILNVLKFGAIDMARIAIVLPLLVNDKIRNMLSKHTDAAVFDKVQHCYSDITLNRVYKEMLPIEINSLVMLSQADLILVRKDIIALTDSGLVALKNMKNAGSNRLKKLFIALSGIMSLLDGVSTEQLYKTLNIQL